MKAILLAAGVGSRIVKDIGQMPKSLVEVNGKPLLLHTLDLLKKNGMEIVIITGFQHKRIEEAIKDYSVTVYYNPFYKVTNSIGSLWYADREFNTQELFIANADVYYTQEMLDLAFAAPYDNFFLSDYSRADEGDYFFYSKDHVLQKYGKELLREERNCEYVGIAVLKNQWIQKFHDRLWELIENGNYDLWWENVLYSYIGEEDIHTVDVNGCFWSEVDTIEDYQRVLKYCAANPDK